MIGWLLLGGVDRNVLVLLRIALGKIAAEMHAAALFAGRG